MKRDLMMVVCVIVGFVTAELVVSCTKSQEAAAVHTAQDVCRVIEFQDAGASDLDDIIRALLAQRGELVRLDEEWRRALAKDAGGQ